MHVSCRPMFGVDKWDEAPALCYVEEPTVEVRELSADIRCKIDDIIHKHEDLQSQMDAVDALLYGKYLLFGQQSDIYAILADFEKVLLPLLSYVYTYCNFIIRVFQRYCRVVKKRRRELLGLI